MPFFRTIIDSIYNPHFYRSLATKTMGSSIWYFLKLVFLISVIIATITTLTTFKPFMPSSATETFNKVSASFPENLTINIQNGIATANQPGPIYIDVPMEKSKQKHFVVIDTDNFYNRQMEKRYDAPFIITKDALVITSADQYQASRVMSLDKIPPFDITRASLTKVFNGIKPYLVIIPLFIFAAVFIGFTVSAGIFYLLYCFAAAVLIWLLTRAFRIKVSYMKCYQIGLHAATLVLLVSSARTLFAPQIGFRFDGTILLLIIVALNLWQRGKKKEV